MANSIKQTLESLIADIKTDTDKATANFEATSVLKNDLRVEVSSRHFEFAFDEPHDLGGSDSAPNPVEYLLAALGACQAITYKAVASLKGIQLDKVNIKTTGDLDLQGFLGVNKEVRPGLQRVSFETSLYSEEDPEKLKRLAKQVESLCPVLDILANPVPVEGKLTVQKPQEIIVD